MSIPLNNRFFQNDLNGYQLHGRNSCVDVFDYPVNDSTGATKSIFPIRGGRIAVLDDKAFDPLTGRINGNGLAAPCDTSQFKVGSTTGIDGAILECRDVSISANSALWFIWAFVPFEPRTSNTFNNFAMFAAYRKSDLGPDGDFSGVTPFYSEVLAQSKKITNSQRKNLFWQASAWQPDSHFNGTLCWIVSTGKFTSTSKQPHPAVLLLDTIDVNRRD